MSRGKKLNIFIGADIDDGWSELQSPRKSTLSKEILLPQKHQLLFKKEKRRGKTLTLVGEFALPKEEANQIVKNFKKKLGCGGKYKDGWMEFQGEIKERLRALLVDAGFRFREGH